MPADTSDTYQDPEEKCEVLFVEPLTDPTVERCVVEHEYEI